MSGKSTSSNNEKDSYLIVANWLLPHTEEKSLRFWERNPGMYSEASVKYFNDCVNRWARRERTLTRL